MSSGFDRIAYNIIDLYSRAIVKDLKGTLKRNDTIASGKTGESITYQIIDLNIKLNHNESLNILSKGIGRGKKVNVNNILLWMRKRNITPRDRPNNAQGRLSTAFAISSSIREKGTIKAFAYNGSNILSTVGEGTVLFRKMQSDIEVASEKYINELIETTLNNI